MLIDGCFTMSSSVISSQAILARERARAEFQDWEKKEEEVLWCFLLFLFLFVLVLAICWLIPFGMQFHFDQSKVRSEIRLLEGRAKPIDILTKHLSGSDDLDIEINEPYMVFKVIIFSFTVLCCISFSFYSVRCTSLKLVILSFLYYVNSSFECQYHQILRICCRAWQWKKWKSFVMTSKCILTLIGRHQPM